MGGGSGSQRTTQTNEPPAFIRPFMEYGAEQSRSLYGTGGPQYYQGNTVVPFSGQTEQALGMTEQRALNGSPITNAAQSYAANTLGNAPTSQFGSGANPWATSGHQYGSVNNPYLDATFNKAADTVQNRMESQFAGSGRNIAASMPGNSDMLSNLATQVYGGAYENERNRGLSYDQQQLGIGAQGYESERDRMARDIEQQRATQLGLAGLSPSLASQDYVDLQALQGVGGQVEDLAGRYMEDQAARWDFGQNAPQINLDNYLARVTGAYPGQNATQTTPTYRNRTAGALGGAATGASVGSVVPGLGTAWGAVLGAGLGYLGS